MMKKLFLFVFVFTAALSFSCSKDKEDSKELKADFTATVGDWKGFSSSDVDVFTIAGRGTVLAITDAKINSDALSSGTLFLYVRYQTGTATSYDLVPYTDTRLGNLSTPELAKTGVSILITKNPSAEDRAKYAVRGIIIPTGKSIPSSINIKNYTEVAKYLGVSN